MTATLYTFPTSAADWNSRALDCLAELSAYLDTYSATHRTVYGRELAEALKADVDGLIREGAHERLGRMLIASVEAGRAK